MVGDNRHSNSIPVGDDSDTKSTWTCLRRRSAPANDLGTCELDVALIGAGDVGEDLERGAGKSARRETREYHAHLPQ